ncbi:RNA polymerase sigma factor [Rufibacter sediminis]|uniref:Sigma-70 family RNA polymerase sigma factor n=1 Tax=Rufibacter sediminis TaxID=2762756 RepID=A0ABR6VQB7_9BACT|nr:sigma-70 family RNA polymerase sigma factor [Rufibacter sediminis]MBC3539130.1 sigma-70 family RNA polymerase sigma factor [Rufibacter sediminis]
MGKSQLIEEESELWDRFRVGDEEAFSQIFAAFSDILYNYGYRLHPDKELVKDCLQDLFVTIWNRRHMLSPTTSIKFYLFRALRREIAVKVKEAAKNSIYRETEGVAQVENPSDDRLIEAEDEKHFHVLLERAVEQLSERQREAVYLRFYQNMEFAEIATLLEITPRAVYKLMYRAIDILQESFRSSSATTITSSSTFVFQSNNQRLKFRKQELQFGSLLPALFIGGAEFFLS